MKTFTYEGELHIRVVPGKRLFNSTMIHEVVNRGDVFALRVSDQTLTIIPGTVQVEHYNHTLQSSESLKEAHLERLARQQLQYKIGKITAQLNELLGD